MNQYRVVVKNFHYPDLAWLVNATDREQVVEIVCELEGCVPESIKEIVMIRKVG